MSAQSTILLIEDTPSLSRVYQDYLQTSGYSVLLSDNGQQALELFKKNLNDINAILLDLKLPDMDGMELLKKIRAIDTKKPIIMITAHGSVNNAVEAMRSGAQDFLVKPFNADRLTITLNNVIEKVALQQIVQQYKSTQRKHYHGFVGSSLLMQSVYRIIDSAASSKATVFITGKSGTGKEVCAQAIHEQSPRSNKPFIALNCGAIPKDLMESEIFGHIKGASTGAISNRDGAATLANGGTLFLDEVAEMDANLQTKLLRFLQTETFQKVGSGTVEKTDIRIICATNKNPLEEVRNGRFREDLYYRLHVIPIQLPPLRERGKDIIEILDFFLEKTAKEEKKPFTQFDQKSLDILAHYPWPGNIRELQNVIRNIVVLNTGKTITPDMLPPPLNKEINMGEKARKSFLDLMNTAAADVGNRIFETQKKNDNTPTNDEEILPLWVQEKQIIESVIEQCEGNIPKAASLLEISPSTIYRKKTSWEELEQVVAKVD